MSEAHIIEFLNSMGEQEMAKEVTCMASRLDAFSEGLERSVVKATVDSGMELLQRNEKLEAALREAREALRTSKGHHIMIGGSGWKSAEMQCAVAIAKINEVLK